MVDLGVTLDLTTIYIITLSCAVEALDEAGALTFGSKENFWDVTGHHKRTSATFYERAPPVNIPARSISVVRNEKWQKPRIWRSMIWLFWSFEIAQGCPPRVSWPV